MYINNESKLYETCHMCTNSNTLSLLSSGNADLVNTCKSVIHAIVHYTHHAMSASTDLHVQLYMYMYA